MMMAMSIMMMVEVLADTRGQVMKMMMMTLAVVTMTMMMTMATTTMMTYGCEVV